MQIITKTNVHAHGTAIVVHVPSTLGVICHSQQEMFHQQVPHIHASIRGPIFQLHKAMSRYINQNSASQIRGQCAYKTMEWRG